MREMTATKMVKFSFLVARRFCSAVEMAASRLWSESGSIGFGSASAPVTLLRLVAVATNGVLTARATLRAYRFHPRGGSSWSSRRRGDVSAAAAAEGA